VFLPTGTDRSLKRPTVVNHALIVANITAFMVMTIFIRGSQEEQARALANLWLHPAASEFKWWTLLTYQFLHDPLGFAHILGNMLFLWVFGPNVEDRLGRIGYLAFYLVGGIAAGAAHMAFERGPVIGASGSIAAVTGAYLVFFPRTRIRVLIFFFIIGIYWIPSVWFIGFAIARDFLFQGFAPGDGVARLAHLGGYAFGIGVCLALLGLKIVPREPYDLFSLGRQAQRRRQFKELASKGKTGWSHEAVPGEAPKRKREPEIDPRIAEARAEVSRRLVAGEPEQAVEAYRHMLEVAGRSALPRRNQIDIANILFQAGEHKDAAQAYEVFLKAYRDDPETARVRLMLGLLYARYLDQPDLARPMLEKARSTVPDASQRELAESLLGEIGATS